VRKDEVDEEGVAMEMEREMEERKKSTEEMERKWNSLQSNRSSPFHPQFRWFVVDESRLDRSFLRFSISLEKSSFWKMKAKKIATSISSAGQRASGSAIQLISSTE